MNTPLLARAADTDGIAPSRRAWAIASVLAAMVLVVLDAAIVNVALPSIGRSLAITPAKAVRVVTAYQLGLVMALLPAASLGETLGFRKVFVAGTALFIAASILCMLSPSLNWLVAARFVQGFGGAGIMALGVALLRFIVPQRLLGAAIGWNALTVALSSAAGPTIGATIISVAPWPWLFALNVPIGILVLVAARALPIVRGTGRRLDLLSALLNAGTFIMLVLGAEAAPSSLSRALELLACAAVLGTLLVRREARCTPQLVPLDLLAVPSFLVSIIASVLCFTGQAAALVALSFYLQHGFGLRPLMAGLYLSPWPLTVALSGPAAGRLANQVPTAWLCFAGGVFLAGGLAAAALWPPQGAPLWIAFCSALCGLGFGMFNVPNNRNMFMSAPRERSGAAGGLQSVARLTGQTAGAVMMTVLFELAPRGHAPRIGLAIAAVLVLAAGLASLLRTGATGPDQPQGMMS